MTVKDIFEQHIQLATNQIEAMSLADATSTLDKAVALQSELQDEEMLSYIYYLRGRLLGRQGKMTEALEQLQQALNIREQTGPAIKKASVLYEIGAIHQRQSNFVMAMQYYHEVETLALKWNTRSLIMRCWQNQALIMHHNGNHTDALTKAGAVLAYYREERNEEKIATSLINVGGIQYDMGNDEKALINLLEAISILEILKKVPALARAYFNVGFISFNRKNYADALRYFKLAANMQEQANNEYDLANTYAYLGSLLIETGRTEEAENILLKGEEICSRIPHPARLSIIYHHQAKLLDATGKYEPALEKQKAALVLQRQINLSESLISSLCCISNYLLKLKKTDEARVYLQEALIKAEQDGLKPAQAEVYECYTLLEKTCGNYRQALEFLEKYMVCRQHMLSEAAAKNIQRLQMQFGVEKKEQQIMLLEREKEQAVLNERLRISRDLHDDMGATLSSISVYSEAVRQRIEQDKPEEAKTLLNLISEDAREMVSNMSDMVWMLNPQNDGIEKLAERIETFASRTFSAKNIYLKFYTPQIGNFYCSVEKCKSIYLIVKEAVNNAAKYSKATQVDIVFEINENTLLITVSDNGIGISAKIMAGNGGNGLKNMQERAAATGSELIFYSGAGGTRIQLAVTADEEIVR